MKKVIKLILATVALPALLLCGCRDKGGDLGESVRMLARVVAIGDRIEVEVLESEYTSGPHLVITTPDTVFESKDGRKISRSDIKVDDTVEIFYSGQVMLSYPPQIVAHRISVR